MYGRVRDTIAFEIDTRDAVVERPVQSLLAAGYYSPSGAHDQWRAWPCVFETRGSI